MNKISIVIPIYNAKLYLSECLDSVINQSYDNIQIILVDNNSTDESIDICNKYLKKDNRIVLLSEKNKGVSYARNTGIEKSCGDWIMFLDADDWIDKDTCKILLECANKHDADICSCSFVQEYKNQGVIKGKNSGISTVLYQGEKNAYEFVESYFYENNIKEFYSGYSSWARIIKKELLSDGLRFCPEVSIGEDHVFNKELFIRARKHVYIDIPLLHYRQNSESAIHKYGIEQFKKRIPFLCNMKKIGDKTVDKKLWEKKVLKIYTDCCTDLLLSDLEKSKAKCIVRESRQLDFFEEVLDKIDYRDKSILCRGRFSRPLSYFLIKKRFTLCWLILDVKKIYKKSYGKRLLFE